MSSLLTAVLSLGAFTTGFVVCWYAKERILPYLTALTVRGGDEWNRGGSDAIEIELSEIKDTDKDKDAKEGK